MAFTKPPARNMPPGSEPWAQWVEEQVSSVTKKSVEAYQYAERAAGGVSSALEGNVQNWDEINRVFEVTEKSTQLADGAVVWSTLDPELPEDAPINPNVIWYTYDPETREVLRMWQWGYYDDVGGVYVEDWYQAQLGADSIHDEAITSAKVALGAIDWDQIAPDVENTVTTAQETAEKAATDAAQAYDKAQTALDEAFVAQGGVAGALTNIQSLDTRLTADLTAAQSAADAAGTTATQAKADALDAFNKAMSVEVVAGEAQAAAGQVQADLDNLQIGGRNFMLNSTKRTFSLWSNHSAVFPLQWGTDGFGEWISGYHNDTPGALYISSYIPTLAQMEGTSVSNAFYPISGVGVASVEVYCESALQIRLSETAEFSNVPAEQWTQISAKTELTSNVRPFNLYVYEQGLPSSTKIYLRNWKLERGNKATDWTPAPEDVDAEIVAVDTKAIAAQASALGAQSKADTADAKASTADGRITIATANPTAENAVGKPLNAVWEVRSGPTVLRKFVLTDASTWTQVKAGQDFIGENAIGSAQIADVAVGTAQIADLAVTNGKIGTLAVDKLRVVGGATMPVAVIDSLVSDQAFLDNIVSQKVIVQGKSNKVGSVLIEDGAVTAPKVTASEELSAKVAQFLEVETGKITWNNAAGNLAFIGALVGEDAFLTNLLAKKVVVGDGTNLWWDQEYQGQPGVGWTRDGLAYKRAGTGAQTGDYTASGIFPVSGGDQLWVSATRTDLEGSTGAATLYFERSTDGGDTWVYWDVWLWMRTAGPLSIDIVVPAGTTHVKPGLYVEADMPTTTTVKISNIQIRRKTGSVLIEDGAVTANKIVANAITARELAVGAITADKAIIANSAIKSAMIANANILSAHIQDLAVTNAKIANTTITDAKILNLDAGKITTGFLDAARIQANSIVASKLSATAIDGMTITGSTIQTSSSANTGIKIDSANGLRAWAGGNLGVQISPSIKNGMAVRSPAGSMVPLSDAAFGTHVSLATDSLQYTVQAATIHGWTRHAADTLQVEFTAWGTRAIIDWSQHWGVNRGTFLNDRTFLMNRVIVNGTPLTAVNTGPVGAKALVYAVSAGEDPALAQTYLMGKTVMNVTPGQTYNVKIQFNWLVGGSIAGGSTTVVLVNRSLTVQQIP